MAGKKKRGLFSWLGFGSDKSKDESQKEESPVVEQNEDAQQEEDAQRQESQANVDQELAVETLTADEQQIEPEVAEPETVEHIEAVVDTVEEITQETTIKPETIEPETIELEATETIQEEVTEVETIEIVETKKEITEEEIVEVKVAETIEPVAEEIIETEPEFVEAVKSEVTESEVTEIIEETVDVEPIETVEETSLEITLPDTTETDVVEIEVINPDLIESGTERVESIVEETIETEVIAEIIKSEPEAIEPETVETETIASEIVEESNDNDTDNSKDELSDNTDEQRDENRVVEQTKPTESFFTRLKRSLQRTKQNIGSGFFGLFKGKKIDDELFEELEEQLLIADVGMDTTMKIIDNLTEKASRQDLKDGEALYGLLKQELAEILADVDQPFEVDTTQKPYVILMVGVNGVGKTTTIGKLAKQLQSQGKSVMLAAGDTFRAAAVEQLQVWGDRNDVPVIAQHTGADSASVIYDAIEAAKARGVDVVIADTAGRLQNKSHLMEELRKIVRVMKKVDGVAPHEVMLTLDAATGQNAISQAKLFSEVAPVTGINLTKLDGTAKGGVIFALADQFKIPIRFIGVGEGIDDLRPFNADDFIEALFSRED